MVGHGLRRYAPFALSPPYDPSACSKMTGRSIFVEPAEFKACVPAAALLAARESAPL